MDKYSQPIKIVIRLLPPNLTESEFWQTFNRFAEPDFLLDVNDQYFVTGHYSDRPFELPRYSRAYVLFRQRSSLEKFLFNIRNEEGFSFSDAKLQDQIPDIQVCDNNRMITIPSDDSNNKSWFKRTNLNNTIDLDPIFMKFLKALESGTDYEGPYLSVQKKPVKKIRKVEGTVDKKKQKRRAKKKEKKEEEKAVDMNSKKDEKKKNKKPADKSKAKNRSKKKKAADNANTAASSSAQPSSLPKPKTLKKKAVTSVESKAS